MCLIFTPALALAAGLLVLALFLLAFYVIRKRRFSQLKTQHQEATKGAKAARELGV